MIADQAEMLRAKARRCYTAYTKEIRQGQCRVIAVTSGKGGVGKTNLVLNLALKLAQMSYRVVLLDADLGLGNLDILINAVPEYTLEDVISGEKDLLEVMIDGPCNLKIIPGGSGLFDLANLDLVRRRRLLDRLHVLEEEGEIIFIDTSAGISRNVLDFIKAADEFIVVTTPEPVALTDAYGMLKVIAENNLSQNGYVVVNFTRHLQQGE
ncbi:MAG TPA: MinD/ParA family protein, partial [Firmicutes bacterium]|nr:MinD/ParA family protein [Bacillota bacterium]